MRAPLALILALPCLGACAPLSPNFRFEPFPETSTFSYSVLRTDATRSDYEHHHLARLARFVAVNHLCPNGYDVVERKVVEVPSYALDLAVESQDVYYRGRCR